MATELSTAQRAPSAASRMALAASRFVDSLTPWQRSMATFPFEGDERYFWHYTPVERNGLLLIDMTPAQQELALALMATGLSERGNRQALQVIALEPMLRLEEHIERPGFERWDRNPLRYYFSVFGQPGRAGSVGLARRRPPHRVPLLDRGRRPDLAAAALPRREPVAGEARPRDRPRTLPDEEDLARELVQSLDADQRAVAIVDPTAPDDLLTKNYRTVTPEMTPVGLGARRS